VNGWLISHKNIYTAILLQVYNIHIYICNDIFVVLLEMVAIQSTTDRWQHALISGSANNSHLSSSIIFIKHAYLEELF
jgi:hypothetical protein